MMQKSYNQSIPCGTPGGFYDLYHYQVDTRANEAETGLLRAGYGVVCGKTPGTTVTLPTAESAAKNFEGIVTRSSGNRYDLDGKVRIVKGDAVGVLTKGRIWVCLGADQAPKYGDPLYLIVDGEDAGKFATTGTVQLPGKFIGNESDGLAPVEIASMDAYAATMITVNQASHVTVNSAETDVIDGAYADDVLADDTI